MKRSLYLFLIVSGSCLGQEFKTYSNGLIYNESTMHKLGIIVDSLNLKFRKCDLAHPYYSLPQGNAYYIEIPSKAQRKLIESGISFEEFRKKFPRSDAQKVWLIKSRYAGYRGQKNIEYSGLPYGWNQEPSITLKDRKANDKTMGWILGENETGAFYIQKLETIEIPQTYARLVQYVDCMIDTTAQIYFPVAETQIYQSVKENSKASQFIKWANNYPGEPKYPDYEKLGEKEFDSSYQVYRKNLAEWDSLRILYLDSHMMRSNYWQSLLMESRDEALATGDSDNRLEFYVARYLSKEDALKLKRSRKVMGNCSMDQSPRYHAVNICQLAAETTQWDIFLRSHLDIMNDRFERQSDGSYAWAGRKTYLKELEELDIPAVDLLLGTCLRVNNVSDQHYWGSIGRIGRALADASDKNNLEIQLLTMIQDDTLDPYNRLLIAYLFSNYNYNLEDEKIKIANQKKLEEAIRRMPEPAQAVWRKGDK